MSDWKITKSDYKFPYIGKLSQWAPEHPFSFKPESQKIEYNEGDEITSWASPVFNTEFTGAPLGLTHAPCGYWHKDYIPPYTIIYTTMAYSLEDVEMLAIGNGFVTGGTFRLALRATSQEDSLAIGNGMVTGGTFRNLLKNYNIDYDSLSIGNGTITGGVFEQTLISYDLGYDSLSIGNGSVLSGTMNDKLIEYTYGLPESLNILNGKVTGGTHGTA